MLSLMLSQVFLLRISIDRAAGLGLCLSDYYGYTEMDEKELYIKDNEASRSELNEAIDDLIMCSDFYTIACEQSHPEVIEIGRELDEAKARVNSLLDVLYGRLYLAECPF